MSPICPLQLRKDNERIQSALQDAVNIRMAKEGEVSVLRKNIEKVIFGQLYLMQYLIYTFAVDGSGTFRTYNQTEGSKGGSGCEAGSNAKGDQRGDGASSNSIYIQGTLPHS